MGCAAIVALSLLTLSTGFPRQDWPSRPPGSGWPSGETLQHPGAGGQASGQFFPVLGEGWTPLVERLKSHGKFVLTAGDEPLEGLC